mmetsp:Transcript_39323/g.87514  ORF Transcript_39323/g.87514 Transcript_39323/m.87514 type:complete len:207 (+) Transcript_39323:450-1070(+)
MMGCCPRSTCVVGTSLRMRRPTQAGASGLSHTPDCAPTSVPLLQMTSQSACGLASPCNSRWQPCILAAQTHQGGELVELQHSAWPSALMMQTCWLCPHQTTTPTSTTCARCQQGPCTCSGTIISQSRTCGSWGQAGLSQHPSMQAWQCGNCQVARRPQTCRQGLQKPVLRCLQQTCVFPSNSCLQAATTKCPWPAHPANLLLAAGL